jgi:hypothetical protein
METLDITDLQGRTLLNYRVNENDFSVDLSQFPVGIYFVRLTTANEILYEKVVRD